MFPSLKKIFISLCFGIILSGILFTLYVFIFVFPYFQDIKYIYNSIPQEQKIFFTRYQDIFICLETNHKGNNQMSLFISRKLIDTFLSPDKMSHLEWHIHFFLWNKLLLWYFDKKEIVILYTYYMPFENGYGVEHSAKFYFNKRPSDLTKNDIITLIAIAKAPQKYSPFKYPIELIQLKSKLYKKLKECKHI